MIEALSASIWAAEQFHQDFEVLLQAHLRSKLGIDGEARVAEDLISRLARSAVILSSSGDVRHKSAAYKIATAASQLEGERLDGLPHLMYIALSRLGNFPAIEFARKKYELSPYKLPVRLAVETTDRQSGNTVEIDGAPWLLTDFQIDLWGKLLTGTDVGISAPTSAGKSFILQSFVRKRISTGAASNAGFIVPTRALINEVAERVGSWIGNVPGGAELVTIPISDDEELPERAVFVVTQERLQLIMESHPELSFDLLVVDEAQSIGDGPRGVLLSSVIQDVLWKNEACQLLFSGPNISNPEQFGKVFGRITTPAKTQLGTVAQNLIFVDCDPVELENAKLSLLDDQKKVPIGTVTASGQLVDHKSKLTYLPKVLGAGGQSLIYAGGAAECEDIAFGLADGEEEEPTPERNLLSEFIGDAVHSKFLLAKSVRKGIGYHYGRLPALVRKEVERSFSAGSLQFLATTSTLLYGVNLPARNLFLHNPSRGQNSPISPIDFWNLAGRAGRLGKEFEGNIFLIDYGEWPTEPLSGVKERVVQSSLERHLGDELGELLAYINNPKAIPPRTKQDEYENTFVKLYRDFSEGTLATTLARAGLPPGSDALAKIEGIFGEVNKGLHLPLDVLKASPTVSVYRQSDLYDRLVSGVRKKGAAYVIPRHPLARDAYTSLLAAFKRCHGEILRLPKEDKSHIYFAMLALRWMKGMPLPQMIDDAHEYRLRNGQKTSLATMIRNVLSEVENDLRFKYVRLMGCYNTVLKQVLRDTGNAALADRVPAIPLYLEVGACSATMMSFMGLGLSRYTATKLSRLPADQEMSVTQAKRWILRQDIDALNIPSASIREIRALVR